MRRELRRAWRVVATAFAFGAFGLGGVVLGLIVFPVLQLCVRDPQRRQRWARQTVRFTFGRFIALMRVLRLISYDLRGLERLDRQGLLVLANHPTLIDVVFLVSMLRNADCIVRSGLADNVFTRGPIRASSYIRNEGGAELLQACIATLQASGNLLIFPEGTRSRPGEPMRMQRGAAQIATRMPCDVTPVTIRCEPQGLSKGRPWWKVADRALHFTISVGEDISIQPFLDAAPDEPALAARHLTAYLNDYFSIPGERGSHAGPTRT